MKKKTLLSWSSGKDSAWALYLLQNDPDIDLRGLFCTINEVFDRVAMHAVRVELLKQQAKAANQPIQIINIPYPCSNDDYEEILGNFVKKAKEDGIEYMAFGDLFLEDVRQYRIRNLANTSIKPLFPVWGIPTDKLSKEMVASGLKARISCIDPKVLSPDFAGREYNQEFLNDLPASIDPCGEKGEFHSFCFAGPMFEKEVEVSLGEIVNRDGFVFADLLAKKTNN
tara:strand:- start:1869 stop:2546 length:678 start_codon:yes stop_codon:yes gene_type:complete